MSVQDHDNMQQDDSLDEYKEVARGGNGIVLWQAKESVAEGQGGGGGELPWLHHVPASFPLPGPSSQCGPFRPRGAPPPPKEGGGAATGQEAAAAAAATAALARLAGLAGLPRAATGVPECFWVHLLQLARPLLEMVQTNAAVTLSSRHLNQLLLKIHEIETMPLKHYAFAGAQDLKELDDNSSEPLTSLVSSAIVKAIYVEHANARPDEQLIRFQMENHGFENAIDDPDSPEESSLHYLPSSADDLLAMAIPLL